MKYGRADPLAGNNTFLRQGLVFDAGNCIKEESMENLQLLHNYFFNNPFVGITVTDGEGKCIMVNDAQTRITGIPREKMLGKNLRRLMDEHIFSVSSTVEVLETGREVNLHQITGSVKKVTKTMI